MRGLVLAGGLLLCVVSGPGVVTSRAAEPEQFFASVFLDKKKIGQFHVRVSRAPGGRPWAGGAMRAILPETDSHSLGIGRRTSKGVRIMGSLA